MSFPRYPAYKESGVEWIGQIPAHWNLSRIKHVLSEMGSGGTPETTNVEYWSSDDGTPWVAIADMSERDYVDSTAKTVSVAGLESKRLTIWPVGTLLFSMYASLGHVAELRVAAATNQAILALVPATGCYQGFLKRWFEFVQPHLIELASSNTQDNLNAEKVRNLVVPDPPLYEQREISSFLDHESAKIDALVAEQERLIALLKEKRQAVISHAVTKGLDPSVPMKDSGVEWLGEVPAHWDVCPLKFLASVGNGSTPNRDNPDYWADEGFPWLNSSVVNQDEVSEAERFVTSAALKECHLPIIEPPAVLVGITGQGKTRGMAAPLTFTATVNQHLAYIKPDQTQLGVTFLLRGIEAAYEHLRTESEGVGSTKGAITCGQLGAWKVPVPALAEQAEIVSFLGEELNKLDALMNEGVLSIELLRERRTALISAAVTGQIDVRGWVPAETAA